MARLRFRRQLRGHNLKVVGSNPTRATRISPSTQIVGGLRHLEVDSRLEALWKQKSANAMIPIARPQPASGDAITPLPSALPGSPAPRPDARRGRRRARGRPTGRRQRARVVAPAHVVAARVAAL